MAPFSSGQSVEQLGWVPRNRNEEHSETLPYGFSEELEAW